MTATLELTVHQVVNVTVKVNLTSHDGGHTDYSRDLGTLNIRQANALTIELDADCGTDTLAGVEGFNTLTFGQIIAGMAGLESYAPVDLDVAWVFDQLMDFVGAGFSPESTVHFGLPK
ncbi:MAG TPA: hypothetical protein VF867_07415 [Arthrobacter sp.]